MVKFANLTGKNKVDVLAALACSEAGLSSAEANTRQRLYGRNQIVFHRSRSPWLMLAEEFIALFPLLLLVAALLAFFAAYVSPGAGYDLIGMALIAVVIINALMSFFQNFKAEKLMQSFLDYIPKTVALLRDNEKKLLDAGEVVPGDILFLQEGDKISADGIVLDCSQLLVDESVLTGESGPVQKSSLSAAVNDTCRVLSGATVLKGNAQVLVVKTGRATNLGGISTLSQGVERDLTPMQKDLKSFVRKITLIALAAGVTFFAIGTYLGDPFLTNLIFAIGIIVANLPEGLLPTVTLALTQATIRMGRCNAVVKQILSVETLGGTTVICTDKTGTLTRNKLHVESLYLDFTEVESHEHAAYLKHRAAHTMTEIMALCHDVIVSHDASGHVVCRGDPTEVAMVEFVDQVGGYEELRNKFQQVGSQPFDADAKYMSATSLTQGGTLYMTVKGAPNVIIDRCTEVFAEGLVRKFRANEKNKLEKQAEKYAGHGMRVLGLAYRVLDEADEEAEKLVFVGFVAMVDPPRPEVPAAVVACKSAGIRIIVISGDKAETVSYIARKLGIVNHPRIIKGEELNAMSKEELALILQNEEVLFAQTVPEQKLTIVEALKHSGEVVAMTGDGVNDAPALKRADIGISMGLRGTDVAKEASDIILLDDNFATIIKAIEEGRAVYDNIRKFITYILASNVPEILPFIAYVLFPIPLPITVVQILSIDLITDMLPAIGLGNEPPESDIMRRKPREGQSGLVNLNTFLRSYGLIGLAETLLAFMVFFHVLNKGGWQWGAVLPVSNLLYGQATGAFLATVIFCQIGNVMACRTNRQSALPYLFKFNPWITAGVVFEVAFIVAVIYLPELHPFFTTQALDLNTWYLISLAPLFIFGVEEIRKYVYRKLFSS